MCGLDREHDSGETFFCSLLGSNTDEFLAYKVTSSCLEAQVSHTALRCVAALDEARLSHNVLPPPRSPMDARGRSKKQ